MALEYAILTPVRDEQENLPRLATSIRAQTRRPVRWIIVDNGSSDRTREIAAALADATPWISTVFLDLGSCHGRGAPIVMSFHAGLKEIANPTAPEIVANVDADVSFDPDFFEQLLEAFESDPELGIASGSALEERRGTWQPRHLTGSTVWGATRAYRWACLQEVLPLEERLGWDGIDEFKANARGWRTRIVRKLEFKHHRPEGHRDGSWRARVEQGSFAYYVGYRPSYLIARAVFNLARDRGALGMIWGFVRAAIRRSQRLADRDARAYLRSQQRLRVLPLRALEALGRR